MSLDLGVTDFQRVVGRLPDFELDVRKSALLVVDMHYFQVHRDFGYGRKARELGLTHVIDYYYGRLEKQVIPRLQEVIPRLRAAGSQIVYCRVVSEKEDGSDFCLRYRSWGLKIPTASREAEILDDDVATAWPEGDDFILDGDRREGKLMEAATLFDKAGQVVDMKPLHDQDQDTPDLVVETAQQRAPVPLVVGLPRSVRQRVLRLDRVVDDDDVSTPSGQGAAH